MIINVNDYKFPQQFRISLKVFSFLTPVIIFFTCITTYIIARAKDEVDPFPYCTITKTASYRPQTIIFRLMVLMCCPLYTVLIYSVYISLQMVQDETKKNKAQRSTILILGLISTILLGITVATIDQYEMYHGLHSSAATVFFFFQLVILVIMTVMFNNHKIQRLVTISKKSLLLKKIFATLFITTWIVMGILYCIKMDNHISDRSQDFRICIVEWGSLLFFALFLLTLNYDWNNLYFIIGAGKGQANQNLLKISQVNPMPQHPQQQQQQQKQQQQQRQPEIELQIYSQQQQPQDLVQPQPISNQTKFVIIENQIQQQQQVENQPGTGCFEKNQQQDKMI
eukprot:TRINITY_DN4026_c0_g1_i1.p1 TRINITY_DN4026_c0_g1~~TRINITY_DN4026_c0_g1_i1.p1  ORF type:complete len:340 (-),score=43.32 TRINITY_DN4026_c0_g1_i1:84-1103(-)